MIRVDQPSSDTFQEVLLKDVRPRHAGRIPQRSFMMLGWGCAFFGVCLITFGCASEYFLLPISGSALGCIGALIVALSCGAILSGVRWTWSDWLRQRRVRQFPEQHWFADFDWPTRVVEDAGRARIGRALQGALMGAAFALPAHWLTFSPTTPGAARLVIGLLTLALDVWTVRQATRFFRLRRLGDCYLELARFPFFLNDELDVTVQRDDNWAGPLTVTLRCLEERLVTSGRLPRKCRKTQVWEVYRETQLIDQRPLRLRLFLPGEARPTALSRSEPRYWELQLRTAPDLEARFLLPIYSPVPE